MLRSILEIMARGDRSFSELALLLNISTRELRNRLQTLENMGYVERLPGIGGEKACTFCPTASGCESCRSNLQFPDSYRITSKGKKLISDRTA